MGSDGKVDVDFLIVTSITGTGSILLNLLDQMSPQERSYESYRPPPSTVLGEIEELHGSQDVIIVYRPSEDRGGIARSAVEKYRPRRVLSVDLANSNKAEDIEDGIVIAGDIVSFLAASDSGGTWGDLSRFVLTAFEKFLSEYDSVVNYQRYNARSLDRELIEINALRLLADSSVCIDGIYGLIPHRQSIQREFLMLRTWQTMAICAGEITANPVLESLYRNANCGIARERSSAENYLLPPKGAASSIGEIFNSRLETLHKSKSGSNQWISEYQNFMLFTGNHDIEIHEPLGQFGEAQKRLIPSSNDDVAAGIFFNIEPHDSLDPYLYIAETKRYRIRIQQRPHRSKPSPTYGTSYIDIKIICPGARVTPRRHHIPIPLRAAQDVEFSVIPQVTGELKLSLLVLIQNEVIHSQTAVINVDDNSTVSPPRRFLGKYGEI